MLYRILAAFIFFTRLPFWRIGDIPKEYYERVVPLWPMVGWLTGGVMGLTAFLTFGLPIYTSVIICLIIRILITGALHEDGFADFCDGFGGGISRQRTLEIMKDSHIGTYGVLGLTLYFMLQVSTISYVVDTLSYYIDIIAVMAISDTFCKWVSSTIIYFLPYTRKDTEAKNQLVYASVPFAEKIISFVLGILPACILLPFTHMLNLQSFILPAATSTIAAVLLFHFMHRRIQGYTGDCCGATFIVCEAVYYLILVCLL